MSLDPRTPVLVGVGQFLQRDPADGTNGSPLDPVGLMTEAVHLAEIDAGVAGLAGIAGADSVRVVNQLSWRYGDAARALADRLGWSPRETAETPMGGNGPQSLVNRTALDISAGRLDLAVLAGGEASRSRRLARAAGLDLHWPAANDGRPNLIVDDLDMHHPVEVARRIMMPVQVYPMFESAIRATAGRSPAEHLERIGDLWARFSRVAASNPFAWSQVERSSVEIRTPSPANRMIGLPYTKYMNSNNDVDMGAALILCSVDKARSLGISSDRWVFVRSGTDCHEHQYFSNRWSFDRTPAVELGGAAALRLAGLSIDEIDLIDLYSCFPSAVQLGAQSLGLPIDAQLTRTGGLPFAGGPWNNYVMHAIATVARELREGIGSNALVWANGGFVTKHAFGVYSTEPGIGFTHESPQAQVDVLPRRDVADIEDAAAAGIATIEAYTVMHGRDGEPETALAACLLPDGRRAWGDSNDLDLARALCDGEWVGRTVTLDTVGALHLV